MEVKSLKQEGRLKLVFADKDEYESVMDQLGLLSVHGMPQERFTSDRLQAEFTNNLVPSDDTENGRPSVSVSNYAIEHALPLAIMLLRDLRDARDNDKVETLQEQLASVQKQYDDANASNESLARQVNSFKSQAQQTQAVIDNLTQQNADLDAENKKIRTDEVEPLKQQISDLNADKKDLTNENAQLSDKVSSLQDEVTALNKDKEEQNAKVESLKTESEAKNKNILDLSNRVAQLKSESEAKDKSIQDLSDQADRLKAEGEAKDESIQNLTTQIENLKNSQGEVVVADAMSEKERAEYQGKVDGLTKQNEELNGKVAELQEKVDYAAANKNDAPVTNEERLQYQMQADKLNGANKDLNEKLSSLQSDYSSLQSSSNEQIAKLQDELKAAKEAASTTIVDPNQTISTEELRRQLAEAEQKSVDMETQKYMAQGEVNKLKRTNQTLTAQLASANKVAASAKDKDKQIADMQSKLKDNEKQIEILKLTVAKYKLAAESQKHGPLFGRH